MKSRLTKVLHPLLGLPILNHVLRAADALAPSDVVVVVGANAPEIEAVLSERHRIAIQEHPLGTADAVAAGLDVLADDVSDVLVLNGDVPLITPQSLTRLVDARRADEALLSLATFTAPGSSRYGRVAMRDGRISGIIEAADDEREGMDTFEANGGVYAFAADWLRENIGRVRVSASGEYYLTTLVGIAAAAKGVERPVASARFDPDELIGVDDRARLAEAEAALRKRVLLGWMRDGVTIVDPERTIVELDVRLAPDVRVEPGSILRGNTEVGAGSVIGPYSVLEDSRVGENAEIVHSWLTGAEVGDGVHIGPYSHMRPGTKIEAGVHIGNYVEAKAATIGRGTRVGHFSYLGDATLGAGVNVGAGTITCNYDGERKHRTVIGDGVFLGSDTMLVAPVELGAGSQTGAGSVVTKSVPPGKTVVGVPARPIGSGVNRSAQAGNGEHGR